MKARIFIGIAFVSFILVSCQREVDESLSGSPAPGSGSVPSNISGTYKVVGIDAHDSSSTTAIEPGFNTRAVSVTNYKGLDITGTFTFTTDKLITKDYGYRVSTTSEVKGYINGDLMSNDHFPFEVTIPPTNGEANYVRNSSDSITVSGGANSVNGGQTVGLHMSTKGDTLMLLLRLSINQTIDDSSVTAQVNNNITQLIKLKK